MSFEPPAGILDIGNATLRVGKLEVAETSGLNQGLQNIVKNDLLITETAEYTTNQTWGLKLPTAWVADFDIKGGTGKYVEFNFYNEGSTSNAQGYTLHFEDTTLTLKYDNGSTLVSATIPTIVGTYRKVNIFFERNVVAVSIDGTRYLYDKRPSVLSRVISTTGSAFLNTFFESDHGGNSGFKNLRIVNGRFISDKTSNVSFIGSLGVGVNSPTESLDVLGNIKTTANVHAGGEIELYSNLNIQHVSNTSTIKANSNVVTEFPRSKKLIKYPRVALTQNALNNGYTVIQSGTNGNEHRKAWSLFNNDVTTDDQYHAVPVSGESNPYNSSTGAYEPDAGFEDGLGDVAGEYVYVVMPDKIKLQGVSVHPRDGVLARSAESARFMGSNDGTTWVDLGGYTEYVWASGSQEPGNFFTVDSNEYYNYIGVVWTKVKGGSGGDTVNMAEVQFFGVPEYDPEAHGTDVVVKSVPNVPNTDWLEVYYDAKGLSSGPVGSSISGLGGTTISATKLGDPQVSNDAFVFDGSGDAIVSGATSLSGKPSLSYSVWFKTNSISSGTGSNSIVMIGHAGATTSLGFRIKGTGDTNPGTYRFYVYGGATNESVDTGIKAEIGTWTHATVVYNGLNSKLYMDGKFVVENTNTATNLALDSGAKVALGNYIDSNGALYDATRSYDGSIANFRLFNRALTSDEVWQLYAYQKEYFGHGDLGMTLKAGRLGIGTSEPKVALDVRGDIYRNGIPAFPIPTAHFYKQSSSTTSTTHTANIRSGWVALTHAHVTVPGVIEAYQLSGANYTTDSSSSGLVVKLCKEGLYKIQFTCALSTQSTINSHIGIDIRPVSTGYISENTGTEHIGLGDANGYTVINAAAGSDAQHMCHRFEILKVTKAPGYAYVSMTPNSNDASHFRFENYGNVPYAVMNVMYLG